LDVQRWHESNLTAHSSLLSTLQQKATTQVGEQAPRSLQEILMGAMAQERSQIVEAFLLQEVAQVLRLPVSQLEGATELSNLGFDSLMSLELRSRVEKHIGLKLPATIVWDYPTVSALSVYLTNAFAVQEDTNRNRVLPQR
jgi:acyl carrier protein